MRLEKFHMRQHKGFLTNLKNYFKDIFKLLDFKEARIVLKFLFQVSFYHFRLFKSRCILYVMSVKQSSLQDAF